MNRDRRNWLVGLLGLGCVGAFVDGLMRKSMPSLLHRGPEQIPTPAPEEYEPLFDPPQPKMPESTYVVIDDEDSEMRYSNVPEATKDLLWTLTTGSFVNHAGIELCYAGSITTKLENDRYNVTIFYVSKRLRAVYASKWNNARGDEWDS